MGAAGLRIAYQLHDRRLGVSQRAQLFEKARTHLIGGAVAGAAAVGLVLIFVALLDPLVRRASDLELQLGAGSVVGVVIEGPGLAA